MKTIADAAMTAIEAGEAIVTGAVEITPRVVVTRLFSFDAEFDYQIIGSIVDADPPEDIAVPTAGFDDTGNAPFGHDDNLTPPHPVATAWAAQTSLWLKKDITISDDGLLTLSGRVENGAVFFLDDAVIGSVNADNSNVTDPAGLAYSFDTSVTAGSHTLKVLALDEAADGGGTDNTYIFVEAILTIGTTGTPIRLWGGHGTLVIDSDDFTGIGARGLAQRNGGAIGGIAQGMTLTLSGIEPAALVLLDAEEIRQASVVLYRLIFASDGKTLLDAHVFDRGRVDTVETDETIGKEAAINVAVESTARGLGRLGARMRADSDQRLIDSDDGYFKNTAYAGQKTLYWGGKKPARSGSALSGSATGGTTVSVGSPTGDRA